MSWYVLILFAILGAIWREISKSGQPKSDTSGRDDKKQVRHHTAQCIYSWKSRCTTSMFSLLFLLYLGGTLEAAEVAVGTGSIMIPAPPGFADITTIAPETVAMFQDRNPTNSRILAVFATTADAGRILRGEKVTLKRYLIAQSVRSLEHITMTTSIFADFRKQMLIGFDELFEKNKPKRDALLDSAGHTMTKRFGDTGSIRVGQILPLGIDTNTAHRTSFSILTKYAFNNTGGKKSEFVSVGTMSMVLLKNRIVYLNVFSTYESDDDLKWARDTSAQWSRASFDANSETFDTGMGSIVSSGTRVDMFVSSLMAETKAVYSTSGNAKARGLNITIKYPSSWNAKEGARPHIVQNFTGELVGGVIPICVVAVYELPNTMKLLIDQGDSEKLLSGGASDLIPPNAKYLDGASTKIDGQPAVWVKYYCEIERAGQRAHAYSLQFVTYYKGNMVILMCGLSSFDDSVEILRDAFDTYLPLFLKIANGIVIEDKWNNPAPNDDVVSSALIDTYGQYWWATLMLSALLTWGVGLLPPILIRFAFVKHALSKSTALILAFVLWIVNLIIFTALGSTSKTHGALFLVAWASYAIYRKGAADYDALMEKDAEARSQREEAEKANAEQIRREKAQREADDARRQAEESKRRAEEERRENDRRRAQQEEERKQNESRQHNSSGSSSNRVKDEHYYASVLGLRGPITADDVRRRYRELVVLYHPDKVNHLGHKLKEVAESEMKEINEAYAYFKRKYDIG